ncbi:anthranilate synthase component II [Halobellus limi]|uniref:anthranilate synthase n=1 Tax=Halobellus limi TaxID=699433 RepID=A0A1H6CUX4_9EURY|nr:aminodeoxychorismate/anthranilate synthase component II [Halobellus limi]QCC49143.1 aminodeoxychorismate/anthranilate synthase component II [Halobellus limi]SEG76315.1 anthranilate synthase component 2 [Halobellus limi]
MILIVDNYDSFAYNLVQYVGEFDDVIVRRNDAVDVDDVRDLDPDGIVVSPGPGTPQDAGVSMDIFAETDLPALGVCLGHQALCAAHGAPVGHAPEVVHGKPSVVRHDGSRLYDGVENPFEVGRYHSLAVEPGHIPDVLVETAVTDDEQGVVMGVEHVEKPHYGVQFHPESILTDAGKRIVENFCRSIADSEAPAADA